MLPVDKPCDTLETVTCVPELAETLDTGVLAIDPDCCVAVPVEPKQNNALFSP